MKRLYFLCSRCHFFDWDDDAIDEPIRTDPHVVYPKPMRYRGYRCRHAEDTALHPDEFFSLPIPDGCAFAVEHVAHHAAMDAKDAEDQLSSSV